MNVAIYVVSAFVLGALHALEPGHGKSVVAAYLVGSRGRVRDAVLLGGVVTATHTASIYFLGLLSIVAAAYIVPTAIETILEIVSGLLVLAVGLWMVQDRVIRPRRLATGQPSAETGHAHEHGHDHGHGSHAHGGHHHQAHADGGHAHEYHADDPIGRQAQTERPTFGTLVTMGVSGGIVPCPAALALLLAAVALGGLGNIVGAMAIVVVFSLGLASVLIGLGIALVRAAGAVRGRVGGARSELFARYAATGSAIVVTALGLAMSTRAAWHLLQ